VTFLLDVNVLIVTDSYLLALACARGGRLASSDRRLSVAAIHGGRDGLRLI
jgi:predicted nucleic acid-binding protein